MTVCFGGLEKNSLTIFSNFLFHLKFELKQVQPALAAEKLKLKSKTQGLNN